MWMFSKPINYNHTWGDSNYFIPSVFFLKFDHFFKPKNLMKNRTIFLEEWHFFLIVFINTTITTILHDCFPLYFTRTLLFFVIAHHLQLLLLNYYSFLYIFYPNFSLYKNNRLISLHECVGYLLETNLKQD